MLIKIFLLVEHVPREAFSFQLFAAAPDQKGGMKRQVRKAVHQDHSRGEKREAGIKCRGKGGN